MSRRSEWIILFVRSLTVFEENIFVTVLAKLVPLFFQILLRFFLLPRSLIDRCQIVTGTCKNDVSKFVKKPFKSPLSLDLFQMDLLYYNAWCANHSITWTWILNLWCHLTIHKCTQEHKHQFKAQRADLTTMDSFHIHKLFIQIMTQHFSWLIRSVLGAYCFHISVDHNSSLWCSGCRLLWVPKEDYWTILLQNT